MPTLITGVLGLSSLLAALLFYLSSADIALNLSPQGCRMSWMSPSYVLQTEFDHKWSPLARRYSLWLYREVGWDSAQETGQRKGSLPVLFIPGNAGSSHQVRSIASSATRQFYSSPYVVSHALGSRGLKPLDFFAVEFNEDLSAFHGSTIASQIAYTSKAISFILSQYPPDTKILIMGHSMGGIVGTSLLPSKNISAIITMSTPHTLPPARFDSRIDALYNKLQETLGENPTPIISICGGAMDMMIPSESCILPKPSKDIFRRTVFTSALEGAWTGVGHREMVWCHQVRWRVARAALELGAAISTSSRVHVLDRWLRDGHTLPPVKADDNERGLDLSDISNVELLPSGQNLVLKNPQNTKIYLLPILSQTSTSELQKLTVLVSKGSISTISPQNSNSIRASIFTCIGPSASSSRCTILKPETLKLIPNPVAGQSFPVPQEGSDESDGVVLYETHVSAVRDETDDFHWIAVNVKGGDGQGWVVAGLNQDKPIITGSSAMSLLLGKSSVSLSANRGLSSCFTFPSLLSNALVVYRVIPHKPSMPSCADALLPPLIAHTSHPAETHYFPLLSGPNRRILLHTHSNAPLIDSSMDDASVKFTIYSSAEPECRNEFSGFDIAIDWSATLGRWPSRYLNTLVSWAAGVASLVVFIGWRHEERNLSMPSIGQSLASYAYLLFRYLLPSSFILAFVPLPSSLYVGNRAVAVLAPIAPLILLVASGLVCVVWWILLILLTIVGKTSSFIFGRRREKASIHRGTMLSLLMICILIFLLVPWQVAYLGCWLLHLHTCASAMQRQTSGPHSSVEAVALSQFDTRVEFQGSTSPMLPRRQLTDPVNTTMLKQNNFNQNLHFLLLMTWLLPLTAPVLAVWVRTLLTAGFTTPFDGDHNFIAVLPFLILTDFASWTPGKLFERASFEKWIPLRWLFAIVAGTAFTFGSRMPYLVLDVARVAAWFVVIFRIGRRYWGGSAWSERS